MTNERQALGKWGEEKAAEFLRAKGYQIIDRNLRNEYGEIDLIAKEQGRLVFVEVKTRSGELFGYPEEAVNKQKQAHILEAAQAYLQHSGEADLDWRIDIISILRRGSDLVEIKHFENAFS